MPKNTAVLIAAYNADKTIRQAVESVLSGSLDCDVYIVDDIGDSDNLIAVASDVAGVTEVVDRLRVRGME